MRKTLLKTGKKYSFKTDGSNDYAVYSGNIANDSLTEFSIMGWVKKDGSGSTYEVAIHESYNSNIGQSNFFLGFHTTGDELLCSIGAEDITWQAGQTGINASLDTWYHLCATWDGSNMNRYVNGVYNGQVACTANPFNNAVVARLGASSNGTQYQFNGKSMDLRAYSRALNANEVLLVKKGIPVSRAGLIGEWLCQEGSGSIIHDTSGNGYNFTISEGTFAEDVPTNNE